MFSLARLDLFLLVISLLLMNCGCCVRARARTLQGRTATLPWCGDGSYDSTGESRASMRHSAFMVRSDTQPRGIDASENRWHS